MRVSEWSAVWVSAGVCVWTHRVASHPRFRGPTRVSRALAPANPVLRPACSPAVPGLAGVGAEASLTPARSGLACPVHLDKLQLTGA